MEVLPTLVRNITSCVVTTVLVKCRCYKIEIWYDARVNDKDALTITSHLEQKVKSLDIISWTPRWISPYVHWNTDPCSTSWTPRWISSLYPLEYRAVQHQLDSKVTQSQYVSSILLLGVISMQNRSYWVPKIHRVGVCIDFSFNK